jgi:hypothetical protein
MLGVMDPKKEKTNPKKNSETKIITLKLIGFIFKKYNITSSKQKNASNKLMRFLNLNLH